MGMTKKRCEKKTAEKIRVILITGERRGRSNQRPRTSSLSLRRRRQTSSKAQTALASVTQMITNGGDWLLLGTLMIRQTWCDPLKSQFLNYTLKKHAYGRERRHGAAGIFHLRRGRRVGRLRPRGGGGPEKGTKPFVHPLCTKFDLRF